MNKKLFQGVCWALLMVTLLSGCRVGPKHYIPCIPMEEEWQSAQNQNEFLNAEESVEVLEMWQLFEDPLLTSYLETLIYQNLDVQAAFAKVAQAYAMRKIAKAGLFPYFDSRIDYHSSKPAGGILSGGPGGQDIPIGNQPLGGIPLNLKQQTFLADFDAVWEIDFFGKKQNQIDSATAFLEMQIENKRAVFVALLAEFGKAYVELRTYQTSKEILAKEIAFLRERVETGKERELAGLDSELTVLTVETTLRNLKSEFFAMESAIASSIYHLSRLLGKTPGALFDELSIPSPLPSMIDKIPVGVPSDLLRRRPDIRYAERELAEKTADVGVSVADLYPRIVIDGSYGFQDLHLGNLKGKGESWSYGGNILSPIFHWGKLRGEVEKNQWIRIQVMIEYENTVLKALEEAESAMVRLIKSKESLQEKEEGYKKQRELLQHTRDLVVHGLANQINLQESEVSTLREHRDYTEQAGDAAIQLIALYKALGGGWR